MSKHMVSGSIIRALLATLSIALLVAIYNYKAHWFFYIYGSFYDHCQVMAAGVVYLAFIVVLLLQMLFLKSKTVECRWDYYILSTIPVFAGLAFLRSILYYWLAWRVTYELVDAIDLFMIACVIASMITLRLNKSRRIAGQSIDGLRTSLKYNVSTLIVITGIFWLLLYFVEGIGCIYGWNDTWLPFIVTQ